MFPDLDGLTAFVIVVFDLDLLNFGAYPVSGYDESFRSY